MSGRGEQFAEHLKFFGELGVTGFRRDSLWAARSESTGESRQSSVASPSPAQSPEPIVQSPQPTSQSPESLSAIREDIGDCVRCKLCSLGRKQIVFGVGNPHADLMFVG